MEYIKPHRVLSRPVTEADVARVIKDVEYMRGAFEVSTCVALAHPQITDKDPLRLYVTREGAIVVNPVIERRSSYTVESPEGCMTFLEERPTVKQRCRKVDVSYQTIEEGKLTDRRLMALTGFASFVAQHEIDHLNAVYIYDGDTGNVT